MTSIREVAKIAGVSPATVSRVMNGTANVDERKKQRVLEAIEKTGFRPNELARALYKKSSRMIGQPYGIQYERLYSRTLKGRGDICRGDGEPLLGEIVAIVYYRRL